MDEDSERRAAIIEESDGSIGLHIAIGENETRNLIAGLTLRISLDELNANDRMTITHVRLVSQEKMNTTLARLKDSA